MAFSLPNFNLLCDIWREPHVPGTDPPDVVGVPCQVYSQTRVDYQWEVNTPLLSWPAQMIRLPPDNYPDDFRFVKITNLTAPYYFSLYASHPEHLGFPNSYFALFGIPCDDHGNNQEFTGMGTSVSAGSVLLESGDHVLLESGDKILTE